MIKNIAILILILTVGLILMNYQTPVTQKTFIYGVYLYVAFMVILFTIVTSNRAITDRVKSLPLIHSKYGSLVLFGIIFGLIYMMRSSNIIVNHVALILFVVAIGTYVGSIINYASNDNTIKALLITAVMVLFLTCLVFMLPGGKLRELISWDPSLRKLLWILIVIQFIMIIFVRNPAFYIYITIFSLVIFILFTVTNTATLIKESQYQKYLTHSQVNYPMRSTSLFLDYFNMFIDVLRLKESEN